jgi:hypothetical protein
VQVMLEICSQPSSRTWMVLKQKRRPARRLRYRTQLLTTLR